MSKLIQYLLRIPLWICLCILPVCASFPSKEGVFTEITSVKGSATSWGSNDFYSHGNTVTNNTVIQPLAQAQDYIANHRGIGIGGHYSVHLAYYCCFNTSRVLSFIKIFKRDNIPINNSIVYIPQIGAGSFFEFTEVNSFEFNVTFDDPTISTPESHVYTLEFWECVGECRPDEYDKKTDKKGEIVINYSVVP